MEFVKEIRITTVILATIALFWHMSGIDGTTFSDYLAVGSVVSMMLVGRAFGTGDIARIMAAKNGGATT